MLDIWPGSVWWRNHPLLQRIVTEQSPLFVEPAKGIVMAS
jgi:hypothetical protein